MRASFFGDDSLTDQSVNPGDLPKDQVRAAFECFGYPWAGTTDPHENDFRKWRDGHPALDEEANALLRARSRALTDKQHGAAADLTDQLQALGIVLRDREGTQQYRRISTRQAS
ncbi:CysS/YqeB C-terminal domain-containing protein [Saccharopolyspora sp. NPDC002376]